MNSDAGDRNVCNEKVFNGLFQAFSKDLHDFLHYKFGEANNPQDIVQVAFEKLWKNCSKVLPEKAKAFIYTVANNEMLNSLSRK